MNKLMNKDKIENTPYHPQSLLDLISNIVTSHFQDSYKSINVYDLACKDGALLLNIKDQFEKEGKDYSAVLYGQDPDFDCSTTRINMDINKVSRYYISSRDPLLDNWDMLKIGNKNQVSFDIVASIPPFSKRWRFSGKDMEDDIRFRDYGLAPKSAADMAYILHGLHYLKDDGIMTFILPHGILFRGGEEEKARIKLLKENYIDAIIGLPANLFDFTGIPSFLLVIKKKRENEKILFIEADKEFKKKDLRKNIMLKEHIDRIVDTYIHRKDNYRAYSRNVSLEEIEKNNYNLNISNYIHSTDIEYYI